MKLISHIVPDPNDLLDLEPEELAGVLLEHMNSLEESQLQSLNRYNFGLSGNAVQGYDREYHEKIRFALMEAWVWLEREGLIAPKPATQGDWVFVTRRGRLLKDRDAVGAYREANLLPRALLHPVIAEKVHSLFLRGDYDTAVFQAFKEVEVAVRMAGKFGVNDIGVDLMRKAFHPQTGPLTDSTQVSAERQSLSDLFAGAIGSYKNPHSHRTISIDAPEAVEMLLLVSHLLRIVDARSGRADAAAT